MLKNCLHLTLKVNFLSKFYFIIQTKTSLLKVDNVGNAMEEAPEKLTNSILLFCKGLGFFTSVNLPGVDRRASQVQ